MSWEDQGRDELGRFGDGKALEKPRHTSDGGDTFGPGEFAQRIQAVAYGSVGALPQALRACASAQYGAGNLARLTAAMKAKIWIGPGWYAGRRAGWVRARGECVGHFRAPYARR